MKSRLQCRYAVLQIHNSALKLGQIPNIITRSVSIIVQCHGSIPYQQIEYRSSNYPEILTDGYFGRYKFYKYVSLHGLLPYDSWRLHIRERYKYPYISCIQPHSGSQSLVTSSP